MTIKQRIIGVAVGLVLGHGATGAAAQCRPASGCERAELASVDAAVVAFMCLHDITGGTIAIARDGVLLYERGFGWADESRTEPIRPNALMRVASVSKPITIAAVREQIADGSYTLDSFAFDLGQPGGGLLDLDPFPSLGDARLADIRVRHLIEHAGGWDRSIAGDLTYREVAAAGDMGLASPPGRANTVRWIMGHPLQFAPGTDDAYSNIGCLTLGLIVEQHAAQPLVEFLDDRVLGPIGIAPDDHQQGRTFRADQSPREPWYEPSGLAANVFDPTGPLVDRPYGGWDHEARVGQGGQIVTAEALARFAAHRWVNGPNIGVSKPPTLHGAWRWNHTGSLTGTSSLIRQRGDGVSYAVIFNKGGSYGSDIRTALDPVFDAISIWPDAPPSCCPADLDGNGTLNFDDIDAFVLAFLGADPAADLDGNGMINFDDIDAFIASFLGGCP